MKMMRVIVVVVEEDRRLFLQGQALKVLALMMVEMMRCVMSKMKRRVLMKMVQVMLVCALLVSAHNSHTHCLQALSDTQHYCVHQ
jgi:hypothetical protein